MERDFKEEEVYNKILELKEGDEKDKNIAFDCIGILANESTTESFENRLEIVSNMIDDYNENK